MEHHGYLCNETVFPAVFLKAVGWSWYYSSERNVISKFATCQAFLEELCCLQKKLPNHRAPVSVAPVGIMGACVFARWQFQLQSFRATRKVLPA